MRATLKDVAKEAGISFTLVSKYLNRNPDARMSSETKKRIDAALKKLDYKPSAVARSLKSGRTKTIGLVISNLRNSYFALFADCTLREVKAAGYQLLISLCDYGREEEQESLRSLIERQCDGIIYCEQMHPPLMLDQKRCPVVLIDQSSDHFLYAKSNDSAALKQAVSFLASRGHRKIFAVYHEFCDWPSIVEEECRRNSLLLESVTTTPSLEVRSRLLREICRAAPTAILSNGWQTTVQLLRLIHSEFPDYRPEIVTNYYFHHPAFSDARMVGIVKQDLPLLVAKSVALLLKRLKGEPAESFGLPSEFLPAGYFSADENEFCF